MIKNEIQNIVDAVTELEQEIAYLECWLRHPDSQSEYEDCFNQLCKVKVELAKLYDMGFNA